MSNNDLYVKLAHLCYEQPSIAATMLASRLLIQRSQYIKAILKGYCPNCSLSQLSTSLPRLWMTVRQKAKMISGRVDERKRIKLFQCNAMLNGHVTAGALKETVHKIRRAHST